MNLEINSALELLLSSDNQRRQEAENYINSIPVTHFFDGLEALLEGMNHENAQVATMAALLVKKKYIEAKENFEKLTLQNLEYMVKKVQTCMNANKQTLFLNRCCDIMVKIYVFIGHQKDIMGLIQMLAAAEAYNLRLALYYLIEISCESAFNDELLLQNASTLDTIFQAGMNSESNELKAKAFKTLTVFLSSIEDEKLVKKFEAVLQLLIAKAIELIKYDQESGVGAMESMNELIESHPKFIKPVLNDLLCIYTEVMEARGLLINLRTTAMHGVFLFCTHHSASIRKSDYFKTKMVVTYMQMLSEIDQDSEQEWLQELNTEIISKNDIAQSTQEHLSQINTELTNKFLLPLFIPHIMQALSSNVIASQHAALVAIALLTEGCHESFKGELTNIINLITPLIQHDNPRLLHDILMVFGYMSEEFAPQIQQNYGDMILSFIIKCLKHPALKVKFMAVSCIQNFQKGLTDHKDVKIVQKYLPEIVPEIGSLFDFGLGKMNYTLLDAILETITTIADMNPFENYYGTFMPGLKKIISMLGKESELEIMVRSRTVETMGYLLASVKDHPQIFEPDCKEIMENIVKMSQNLEPTDPLFKAIFVVYENVVSCLKDQFSVYADYIYPSVLAAANRKVEFTVIDETETSKQVKNPNKNLLFKMKIDLKIDGVKNIVMNTDTLTQKIQSTNLMVQMAEDMGTSFGKYIEQSIPTVVELISFKNNKEIRSNMIEMIRHMMKDCVTQEQKLYVLEATYGALCNELSIVIRGRDYAETSCIVETMAEMMPYMNEQMGQKMPQMMEAVLNLVKSVTSEVEKFYSDKEMDETTQQEMDKEIQQIQQSLEHVQTIIKQAKGIPAFENLRKLFPKEYQFE